MVEVMAGCTRQFLADIGMTVELKLSNALSAIDSAVRASSVGKYVVACSILTIKALDGSFLTGREEGVMSVMLLVASLQTLDIPTTSTGRMYSLDEIVTEMADAVRNGQLSKIPVTVDGTEVIVGVSTMGGCGDLLCSSGTNITILATSAAATPHLNMLIVLNLVASLFVSFAAMW